MTALDSPRRTPPLGGLGISGSRPRWLLAGLVVVFLLLGGLSLLSGWIAAAVFGGALLVTVFAMSERDAVAVLSIWLILIFLVNARFVVPPLGQYGAPALLVTMACGAIWLGGKIVPDSGLDTARNPMRIALLAFACALLIAYGVASSQALSSQQAAQADVGLVLTATYVGFGLFVTDGIKNRERLDVLLRRMVLLTALMAVVGLLQYFANFDLVQRFQIPGLAVNGTLQTVVERGGNRVGGTTLHPIEFGIVLASVFPLAIHYALYGRRDRTRPALIRDWASVGLIALAIPTSVSRSALIVLVVALGVYTLALTRRQRLNTLVLGLLGAGILAVIAPGLLGTIKSYFVHAAQDPSIAGRTVDLARVNSMITEAPVFGNGLGFYVSRNIYEILDSQLLTSLVETGVVGTCAMLGMWLTGIACCVAAWRRNQAVERRSLAAALAASLATAPLAFAFFDALGHPVYAGVEFFLLGVAGALWRIEARPLSRAPRFQSAAEMADTMSDATLSQV